MFVLGKKKEFLVVIEALCFGAFARTAWKK